MKPSPAFEYRKVAVPTVMKKIDVMNYHRPLRNDGMKEAERVRIPLNRHTGAPAVPTVVKGQKVKMCDVVAETPKDKLGCAYHASIAGKVTDVTEYWVEIRSV
jgi:Na+-translocating ferredoxin:NAD+ oxidoreductase RnfC subunit